MVIAEESAMSEVVEIDLKCAEKVTDSDAEESNSDSEDKNEVFVFKSGSHDILKIIIFLFLQNQFSDSTMTNNLNCNKYSSSTSYIKRTQTNNIINNSNNNNNINNNIINNNNDNSNNNNNSSNSNNSTNNNSNNNNSNNNAINNNNNNDAKSRDITCKPKPIKAQINADNTMLNYQQSPLFAYSSPKNPVGISPFVPKGQ